MMGILYGLVQNGTSPIWDGDEEPGRISVVTHPSYRSARVLASPAM